MQKIGRSSPGNAGDEIPQEYGHLIHEHHYDHNKLFLFFFPCVDKKRLQFSFRIINYKAKAKFEIRKCVWRVLCKEDVETWRGTGGEGCSTSNNDSDDYHSLNDVVPTEATSDSSSNSQFVNSSDEEDGQGILDADIQMPLTKRRKL